MRTFAESRYDKMTYRRCGRTGLMLPAISLGAWQTFGGYRDREIAQECLFRAFDLGITHFDLANNYGQPPGNAEIVIGEIIKDMPRDELIISSKAGYRMWKGPYGEWGSRKYMIASCDQSLKRMKLDYFDIFYSHRPDPNTPFEETMGALQTLVQQGKAIYAGVSNYSGKQFSDCVMICKAHGWMPITIHQPYYNLLGRTIEKDLLPHTEALGTGVIPYCPLSQGLLTNKYLSGIPTESRAIAGDSIGRSLAGRLTPELVEKLKGLDQLATARNQSLAQMALAWILRLPGITSALIGASNVKQIEDNVAALDNLEFTAEELRRIDELCPP